MVLEEFLRIQSGAPCVLLVVQPYHPTAELVAFGILVVVSVGGILAAGYEGVPEGVYALVALKFGHRAVAVGRIGVSAEERSHLQSEFEGEGIHIRVFAYAQESGLGVIEHVVGIAAALGSEVVLP